MNILTPNIIATTRRIPITSNSSVITTATATVVLSVLRFDSSSGEGMVVSDAEMVVTEGVILVVCLPESSVGRCDVEPLGGLAVESVGKCLLLELEIWMDGVRLLEEILLAFVENRSLVEIAGVASINPDERVVVVAALEGSVEINADEKNSLDDVLVVMMVVAALRGSVEIDADEKNSLDDVLVVMMVVAALRGSVEIDADEKTSLDDVLIVMMVVAALGGSVEIIADEKTSLDDVLIVMMVVAALRGSVEIDADEKTSLDDVLIVMMVVAALGGSVEIDADEKTSLDDVLIVMMVVAALRGSVEIIADEKTSLDDVLVVMMVVAALGGSVEIDADEKTSLDDVLIVMMVVAALRGSVEIIADEKTSLDDVLIVMMVVAALRGSVEINADRKILDDVLMAMVAALGSSVETVDVATIKVDERISLNEMLAVVAVVVIAMGSSVDVRIADSESKPCDDDREEGKVIIKGEEVKGVLGPITTVVVSMMGHSLALTSSNGVYSR